MLAILHVYKDVFTDLPGRTDIIQHATLQINSRFGSLTPIWWVLGRRLVDIFLYVPM